MNLIRNAMLDLSRRQSTMPAIRFGHMVMRPILVCIIAAVVLAQPATVGASLGYSSIVLAHKPAAYWRLGDAACCVALDSSPNGRNAIYEGQPLLGQPGAIANDPNTSAGFDGGDVVWYPTSSYAGPFTVVAWIRNTGDTGSAQTFFDTRTPNGEYSFDFKLELGNLKVDVGNGSSWFLTGPGIPYTFHTNTWYQVAAVVTGTSVTLYVDGQPIGSESYPFGTGTPLLYDQAHAVYLGTNARYPGGELFMGGIDEVAIYPTPLTPDAIAGLYQSGVAGSASSTTSVAASIAGVAFTGGASSPTVTVKGSGFGANPPASYAVPCTFTGSNFNTNLWIQNYNNGGIYPYSWQAGYGGNCVGLTIKSWTPTQIVFAFGSGYTGQGGIALYPGDNYTISVYGSSYSGVVSYP